MVEEIEYETLWKCWKCGQLCSIEAKCGRCNLELQDWTDDNMDGLIVHMPKKRQEEEQPPQEPYQEPLAPNEFFCKECTYRNVYDEKDTKTAYCEMCGQ